MTHKCLKIDHLFLEYNNTTIPDSVGEIQPGPRWELEVTNLLCQSFGFVLFFWVCYAFFLSLALAGPENVVKIWPPETDGFLRDLTGP